MYKTPITSDGEWEEDELLSLVMDECYRVCKRLNEDIAKGVNVAWYDNSLLYAGNLCQKAVGENSMVDKYNELGGLDQFEDWMREEVNKTVENNRYKHYRRAENED